MIPLIQLVSSTNCDHVDLLNCRPFILSTFLFMDLLVCWPFLFVNFLVCRPFDLSIFAFVSIFICRPFHLSTLFFVDLSKSFSLGKCFCVFVDEDDAVDAEVERVSSVEKMTDNDSHYYATRPSWLTQTLFLPLSQTLFYLHTVYLLLLKWPRLFLYQENESIFVVAKKWKSSKL